MNDVQQAETSDDFSPASVMFQCTLMAGVFYLWSTPLIRPVKIMVVLFHEMSHGIVALLSGGQVRSIVIAADEGGACETVGGIPILIVSAGYLGSMFFGGLLLYLSRTRGAVPVIYSLLTLVLTAAVVTVIHDPYTRTFATTLAGTFIFLGLIAPAGVGSFFLRILGTVSCLYSILDIYHDILVAPAGAQVVPNDATAFASMTGIPASTVGLSWLCVSVVFFLAVLRSLARASERSAAQPAL